MADWLTRSPEEGIEYDVDVLFGAWPSHPTDTDLASIKAHLAGHQIQNALAISTRGALFSDRAGNAETFAAASDGLIPVGTVDLRDPLTAIEQLDAMVEQGVRFLRLFTVQQGVLGDTPGYRHVVREALERNLVLLQDGDPRKFGDVLAGRGADVIFLDLHVYLLGDFILMAQQEQGFRATTRMLSSPDGIERVVDSVGARHLVFGSRTPFMDVSPQTLRLRYARISVEDRELIAGGNVRGMYADH
jgi:predicted TIM-barrel fold metal-dependent hydrolase